MDTADRILDEVLACMAGQPEQIIDELNFSSYRTNRELGVTAAQLEKWFFPATGAAFERRYQDEVMKS